MWNCLTFLNYTELWSDRTFRCSPQHPQVVMKCVSISSPTSPSKRKSSGGLPRMLGSGNVQSAVGIALLQSQQERLQKLRLVSRYRKNHSLGALAELERQWTAAAQQALVDLRQLLLQRGQDTQMLQLLEHLTIDPALVRYDAEAEDFTPAGQ